MGGLQRKKRDKKTRMRKTNQEESRSSTFADTYASLESFQNDHSQYSD